MNKKVISNFILAILLTIMLPVGIVFTVIGATQGNVLLWIGIVMTVLGFYGSPISWIKYGENKFLLNLFKQITEDDVQSISELAQMNGKNNETILQSIKDLFSKRYLVGYEILDNEYIILKEKKKLTKNELLEKSGDVKVDICPGCGAPIEIFGNEKPQCKYCGRRYGKN